MHYRTLILAVVLGAAAVPALAQSRPCERFALEGLSPGMTYREVRRAQGGPGQLTEIRGIDGSISEASYAAPRASLVVRYDAVVTKRSNPTVASVRSRQIYRDPASTAEALARRFGPPSVGQALPASGGNAATVWHDATCRVQLTARVQRAAWWEPGRGPQLELTLERWTPPATASAAVAAVVPAGGPVEPPPADADDVAQAGPTGEPAGNAAAEERRTVQPASAAEPAGNAPTPATPAGDRRPDDTAAGGDPIPAVARDAPQEQALVPLIGSEIGVEAPVRTHYVPPRIPARAEGRRIAGNAEVNAVVRTDGSLAQVQVVKVPLRGVGLEAAVTDAVRRWRYDPARRNGEAVAYPIRIVIEFR